MASKVKLTERIFDVEITITKTVRVRVPDDPEIVYKSRGETQASVAEEFALGGKASWPEYVISSDEDYEIEGVKEVFPDAGRALLSSGKTRP